MSRTDTFRRQHDDLLQIAGQIASKLGASALSSDAGDVSMLLSKLMGKLKIHLSMEDDSLYPRLIEHDDPKISSLAKSYKHEMVGVSQAVMSYAEKWHSPNDIQADAASFVSETQGLFKALQARIDKENSEPYPAADAA